MITPSNVSRLHKIASDEMWHFYLGTSMTVQELIKHADGSVELKTTVLGNNILADEQATST